MWRVLLTTLGINAPETPTSIRVTLWLRHYPLPLTNTTTATIQHHLLWASKFLSSTFKKFTHVCILQNNGSDRESSPKIWCNSSHQDCFNANPVCSNKDCAMYFPGKSLNIICWIDTFSGVCFSKFVIVPCYCFWNIDIFEIGTNNSCHYLLSGYIKMWTFSSKY